MISAEWVLSSRWKWSLLLVILQIRILIWWWVSIGPHFLEIFIDHSKIGLVCSFSCKFGLIWLLYRAATTISTCSSWTIFWVLFSEHFLHLRVIWHRRLFQGVCKVSISPGDSKIFCLCSPKGIWLWRDEVLRWCHIQSCKLSIYLGQDLRISLWALTLLRWCNSR